MRLKDVLLIQFCELAIVIILVVVGYSFLNVAQIPVSTANIDFSAATASSGAAVEISS